MAHAFANMSLRNTQYCKLPRWAEWQVAATGVWVWQCFLCLNVYICVSLSMGCVFVCMWRKGTLIESTPLPRTVPGTKLFKKWRSAGRSPSSGTLIKHTPDLQSVLSLWAGEKMEGRQREKLRDAVPATLFEEKMANTCSCPSADTGWQIFQGNTTYHSTEAKSPALSQ